MPNAYAWNLGRNYDVTCNCSKPGGAIPGAVSLTTKTDLAKGYSAEVNGEQRQFFKVNRNIQVASEVWIAGKRLQFVPVPLASVSNLETGTDNCGSNGMTGTFDFGTGSQGRLHLLIGKPFIGESVIPRTKLFDLMATMEGTSTAGAPPMVNVWMSGSVVVPQSCQLAPGQAMTIDFGNLNPWELPAPGESPQRTVSRTFKVKCENISEMVAINLTLEGNPHQAQSNALAVNDRSDLAIILKEERWTHRASPARKRGTFTVPPHPAHLQPGGPERRIQSGVLSDQGGKTHRARSVHEPGHGEVRIRVRRLSGAGWSPGIAGAIAPPGFNPPTRSGSCRRAWPGTWPHRRGHRGCRGCRRRAGWPGPD